MFVIWWIVAGILAGLGARLLMPGQDKNGIGVWLVVSTVGSIIGGAAALGIYYVSGRSGSGGVITHPHLWVQIAGAVMGSLIAVLIYRFVAGRRMPPQRFDASDGSV